MTKAGEKAKAANRLLLTYQQAVSNAARMAGRPLREQEKEIMAVLVQLVAAAIDFLRAYERQVLGAGGAVALAKSGGWFSAKPPGFAREQQRNFGYDIFDHCWRLIYLAEELGVPLADAESILKITEHVMADAKALDKADEKTS